jgi:hypothetical protein
VTSLDVGKELWRERSCFMQEQRSAVTLPTTLTMLDPPSHDPTRPMIVTTDSVVGAMERAVRRRLRQVRRGWGRFKRLTQIGLPPSFPIVQFPNAPLIVAFLAAVVAGHIDGPNRAYARAVAYLAMTIWAYEELARGVNWFRRLLGATYMIIMIIRVAHALHA